MELKKNIECNIKILDLGVNGEGIGKINNFTIFVENAVPRDTALIKILKVKKSYAYGKLIKILEPSPIRTEPKCRYFSKCGGCSLQHIDYNSQLDYKTKKVKDTLERIGGLKDINIKKAIGMDYPYYYRNKAQYPVREADGKIQIGFYAPRSHNIIDSENCFIQNPENEKIISYMRDFISEFKISAYNEEKHSGEIRHILTRIGYKTKEIMLCIVVNSEKFKYKKELIEKFKNYDNIASIVINYNTNKTNVILGNKNEVIYGNSYITDYIGDLKFEISALSFYQVNPVQTKVLYDKVLEYAELKENETVIDAYCGIGTISLYLSKKAKHVIGVEIIEDAVKDAIKNAKINNIDNAEFITGKSEEIIPMLYKNNNISADLIVVDPPRKGCDENLLNTICSIRPNKIIYVSCDSGTLARDLKFLTANGYSIKEVQPVDQFCMTSHIENVVLLIKN